MDLSRLKMNMDPWNTNSVHPVKLTVTGQLKWLWD
ncbi:hypothetical protein COLO4_12188 [Corchorus olitorius]|uniref:Uncharacterized protein n=1 Tax=Corchorus olitorius TaxID=93759 RepID=A0A1R3K233_9ROSI|nr:hypothetical protein COLO4_12188 [Corchorus olitorius]